jgi:hypothetical protein
MLSKPERSRGANVTRTPRSILEDLIDRTRSVSPGCGIRPKWAANGKLWTNGKLAATFHGGM